MKTEPLISRATYRKSNIVFYTILALYIVYCLAFIIKASFSYNGTRYFTLIDDAMISMRYAKNLAHGDGLIWNPGEARVEGYTNFLWTIYMAFWHLLPISAAKMSLPIQITGLFFLIGSLFLVRKIAEHVSNGNGNISTGAVLLTASYLPINFWALRGVETSVLGFILLLATWRLFVCLKEGKSHAFLFVILGIGMLTRVDFAFLFAAITVFVIVKDAANRRKNLLTAALVFIVVVGGSTLFRWWYYGDVFPNTYYLKMTGVSPFLRIQCGLWRAARFALTMTPVLFALPLIYGGINRRNTPILFLLYLFLAQLSYSIYVGGDAWEWWGNFANRYLCMVMPAFFILTALAADHLIERILVFKNSKNIFIKQKTILVVTFLLIIFQMHGGILNLKIIKKHLLGASGIHVDDDSSMARAGVKLKNITGPHAKIAVVCAGNMPYFSDRSGIDLLGKSDAFIAHLPARVTRYTDFQPGHNKYNYAYSIGQLKPDIIGQLWRSPEEVAPWADSYVSIRTKNGAYAHFRKESQNIFWDKISDELRDWIN